jgi:hypothetical protein
MAILKNVTVNDTGFIDIPSGNIAQRPASPTPGMIRFNTEIGVTEYWNGSRWIDPATGLGPKITRGLIFDVDANDAASNVGYGFCWADVSRFGLPMDITFPDARGAFQYDLTYNTGYLNTQSPGTVAQTISNARLDTDTHTISFWIRFNAFTSSFDKLFSYNAGGTDRSPSLWRIPNGYAIHWKYNPGNTGPDVYRTGLNTGTQFSPNVWYHVTGTKNGATFTAYVNGISIGSVGVAAVKTAGSAPFIIFEVSTGFNLTRIAQMQIYEVVLTPEEILQNYNATRIRFGY